MKTKTKILIVGAFPKDGSIIIGGQLTSSKLLIESQISKYFEIVTVDSTQKSNPPPKFIYRLLFASLRFVKWVTMTVIHRPKVVLLFFSSGASALEKGIMTKICNTFNLPVIVLPRAEALITDFDQSLIWKKIIKWCFKDADVIICQGQKFQDFAINKIGFSPDTAPIITNWTATDAVLNIGKRRVYQRSRQTINILFIAWVEETKGIFDLITACETLKKRFSQFKVTIAGDGTALEEARVLVERKSLSNLVDFKGWVHEKDKISLLKKNDVFVLPSWSEGFPNSLIEALSAGLASIVTDVGAIRGIVTHEKEALIIPKQEPLMLASAIERLIEDKASIETIGRAGYDLSKNKFATKKSIDQLITIINKALKV